MAQVSKFPRATRGRKGGSWLDPYLDGQVWKLNRGDDFSGQPRGVQAYASALGKQRGIRIKTQADGNTVYLQAEKVQ